MKVCCELKNCVVFPVRHNNYIMIIFKDFLFGLFVPLFQDRTAEEWTGNRGERGGMTCSKGPQVESNPGPMHEDKASVYVAPALPTVPPGAPSHTS